MRKPILLFFLFVCGAGIRAQDTRLRPLVFVDTTTYVDAHAGQFLVLPDRNGELTVDDLRKPQWDRRFTSDEKKYKGKDGLPRIFWVKLRLRNETNTGDTLFYEANYTAKVSLYYPAEGTSAWVRKMTGDETPWSLRSDLKREVTAKIPLGAQREITLYIRIETKEYSVKNPNLHFRTEGYAYKHFFIDHNAAGSFFGLVFFGMILFASAFNLFFFVMTRERVYGYYALSLLFGCLASFVTTFGFPIVREYPVFSNYLMGVWVSGVIVFSINTIRHFYKIPERFPRWNRILLWTNVLFILLLIISRITQAWAANILIAVLFFSTYIQGLVVIFIDVRRKTREAWLGLAAFAPLLLSIPVMVMISILANGSQVAFDNVMLICIAWLICVFSFILFDRYKQLTTENARQAAERVELIASQKARLEEEVAERTSELKQSLENLKATQSQLIQAEKMASLGELTAGIAHEIQNPLNFVNNFSEVSGELVDELKEEMGNGEWGLAAEIADDIKQNLEKIAHHGKRADNIVKGMLQHSRTGAGVMELVSVNSLVDEYLRLSYHGFRAKEKSFNASLHTEYDPMAGTIRVIPQELGRVLLNLLNNAFYAVNARSKAGEDSYQPGVSLITRRQGDDVLITIRDNGTGIPKRIAEKVFQPFFTTKPTGEGTGLGLSLSYDIVTKVHNGELTVESEEGVFTAFSIRLPVENTA